MDATVPGMKKRQVNTRLSENEILYQTLFEASTDAIFVETLGGRVLDCNSTACQMFGYTHQEFLQLTVADLVPQEVVEKLPHLISQEQITGGLFIEAVNRKKDGMLFPVEVNTQLYTIQDEPRVIVYVRDLTGRKKAEKVQQALYQISEAAHTAEDLGELYRLIHSIISELMPANNFYIALYDRGANLLSFPYYADEADEPPPPCKPGRGLTEYILAHGQPLLTTPEVYARLLAEDEVEIVGTDSVDWLGVPLVIHQNIIGMMAVQTYTPTVRLSLADQDVLAFVSTQVAMAIESKQAEKARRESEERYRSLFETAPVSLLLANTQGQISEVNQVALSMLGSPSAQATKAINLLTFPLLIQAGFSADFQRCIDTKKLVISECLYTSKWGKTIFIHYYMVPILAVDGEISLVQVIAEDITEWKMTQEKIQKLNQDLEQQAKQLSHLYKSALDAAERRTALHWLSQEIIGTSLEPERIYTTIHQAVQKIMPAEAFIISILDEEFGEIILTYCVDQGQRYPAQRIPRLRGLSGYVIASGKSLIIHDLEQERSQYDLFHFGEEPFVRSILAVPMRLGEKIFGLISAQSYQPQAYTDEDSNLLEILAAYAAIALDNSRLFTQMQAANRELGIAYEEMIEGWSRALEMRDKETKGHSDRVTRLSLRLAQAMGMSDEDIIHFRRGVLLHDIGKMAIPDSILLKPSSLSEDEWIFMRQHPSYAYQMLGDIPFIRKSLDVPYCHHEKWDGSGYPRGLKGEDIPLGARIFAVVDVWDALINHRPYRLGWLPDVVRSYIDAQSGAYFDPRVVVEFLKILDADEVT